MTWASLRELLEMGGYGFYVWTAFATALLCMVFEVAWLRRHLRAAASESPHGGREAFDGWSGS